MKKLLNLGLVLSLFCYSIPTNASVWSMWSDEDEETEFAKYPTEEKKSTPVKVSEKTVINTSNPFITSNFQTNKSISTTFMPEPNSVVLETQYYNTSTYPSPSIVINQEPIKQKSYDAIDYDTLQYERALTPKEISNSINKWEESKINTHWENYRGNTVRIEVLKGNRDIKEMRLKFIQSSDLNTDSDGSVSDMLGNVAEKVMKSVCGRKARQSIILYERPSVEVKRETPASGYKVITKGTSIKEYGFRCIY